MGDNNKQKITINEDAKKFAELDFKRFKKKNKDFYDSKSELKDQYFQYLLELLPDAIEFCVKFGHIQDARVQEAKMGIYTKINDPDFIKLLKKEIKHDNEIGNIKLFPIIAKEILEEAKKENDKILAQDPNATNLYDVSDVSELSQIILKKKINKLEKIGVPVSVAFDLLSIIPNKKAISFSERFRIKMFYLCLYEHSKTVKIPFKEIIDTMIPDEYYPGFILFALLERKEVFGNMTDAQKELYLSISNWCFDTMEKDLSNKCVENIILSYINGRRRDEMKGRDGNRRYALSSLSETDYARIAKTVQNFIANDDSVKKYLN